MAFLTMIAPLVAITYPIDRLGDGHAQAFTMWFREYIMNAMMQPLHLVLYTALVSSATNLVVQNPIYALVAIGFLIPAEKFVKSMFGFNKAETPGTLGGFAAGALAGTSLKSLLSGPKGGSSGSNKLRTADNDSSKYLSSTGSSGIDSDTLSGGDSGANSDIYSSAGVNDANLMPADTTDSESNFRMASVDGNPVNFSGEENPADSMNLNDGYIRTVDDNLGVEPDISGGGAGMMPGTSDASPVQVSDSSASLFPRDPNESNNRARLNIQPEDPDINGRAHLFSEPMNIPKPKRGERAKEIARSNW